MVAGAAVDFAQEVPEQELALRVVSLVDARRQVNIEENRQTVSSLIQFAANLCFGTGKFRRLLIANEAPIDFINTLTSVLQSVQKPIDYAAASASGETSSDELISKEGSRVLLKATALNFIGNLTVEQ